jgi:hypothetical protein
MTLVPFVLNVAWKFAGARGDVKVAGELPAWNFSR